MEEAQAYCALDDIELESRCPILGWYYALLAAITFSRSTHDSVAANAEKLRRKWFRLQGPPRSGVVEQEELERQGAELKKRMAEFLADVLLS